MVPWPISEAGDIKVTWPLLPTVIQALGETCLVAALISFAAGPLVAQPVMAKLSVKLPELIMKVRRDAELVLFIFRPLVLTRSLFNRSNDLVIGSAAANIACHVVDNLLTRGILIAR